MPTITSSGALNRHITEYLTTDKRVKQYKCKTLQNPDYYRTPAGLFLPVDIAFVKDAVSTAGAISLRDKGIVSVGFKKADNAYKLFGLRPDEKQDGSEQFEVSVESIEINGKAQTINLRDRVAVSPITTKFGDNLYLQHARQRTRVMVEGNNAMDGFKVALRLHLKGLTVTYRPDLDEYWIYNEKGDFRFRLGKPYLVDFTDMNPLRGEIDNPYPSLVKHSLAEISEGEYLYVKEPTEMFDKVVLPDKFLIDADTVYSSTADGYVERTAVESWQIAHDAASGTSANSSTSYDGNVPTAYNYGGTSCFYRGFFYYSLSALSGTVTAVTENIYGFSSNSLSASIQKGIQSDSLVTGDYSAFSGGEYNHTTGWSLTSYNVFTYNSTGISDVQAKLGGTHKTCLRGYPDDYLNTNPGAVYNNDGVYFAENTGTSKDPYLYIATEAAAGNPWNYYAQNM